ncbi:unnamed protein product [Diamesa serratosioi]
MEDLEEHIPVFELNKNENQSQIVIVKKSTNDGLFLTTEYEKVKLKIQSVNRINNVVNKKIMNVVSLTIHDIKFATFEEDCFKVHGFFFRKVLCYARLVLKNIFTSTGNNVYLFNVDDGTQEIIAKFYKNDDLRKSVAINKQWLTIEKNRLSRLRETGINVNGKYLDPQTKECQKVLQSVQRFQLMIHKNIDKQKHDYHLGPIAEKALLLARPYKTQTGETQLYIYDISLNDKIELYWKRSLSKIYNNQYLKKH